MANNTKNPKRALPYSLFSPILLGGIIYMLLSLSFITCLSDPKQISSSAVAPLLGLVALFGINIVYVILFADAVLAPLGTANVYTAITGRVLYGLSLDFMPKSILTRLNKYHAPYVCLWISALVGMCFLFPFPTWRELVDFLSSVVVFVYIAGPISLLILRKEFPELPRTFKTKFYRSFGYVGFACCSLFIYWSELQNLVLLSITLIVIIVAFALISKKTSPIETIKHSFVLVAYVLSMTLISYLHSTKLVAFPYDNLLVIIIAFVCCKFLVATHLPNSVIKQNLEKLNLEINSN